MSTTEFPEVHWNALREAMEQGGPDAVIAFINGFGETERLKLYGFAQRAFSGREWSRGSNGKNFDDYIAVVNGGIAEAIRQSEAASDPATATNLKDTANIFSYNLLADLAECWPGDNVPRERRHFEAGLRAAEDCIRWRDEIGKPPSRKSMAWWGKGMHQLSLGDFADAEASFQRSLEYAMQDDAEKGIDAISVESSYSVPLSLGYVALAQIAGGRDGGAESYATACALLKQQCDIEGKKEDAEFCLEQLRKVESKFGASVEG